MTDKKHIIINIDERLKQEFQIRCIRQKTDMTEEIVRFIKGYVGEKED